MNYLTTIKKISTTQSKLDGWQTHNNSINNLKESKFFQNPNFEISKELTEKVMKSMTMPSSKLKSPERSEEKKPFSLSNKKEMEPEKIEPKKEYEFIVSKMFRALQVLPMIIEDAYEIGQEGAKKKS